MPSKPHIVSALSGDDEAEMEKMTAPPEDGAAKDYSHLDEFVGGLNHEELEYIVSCAQKKLDEEGDVEMESDAPPEDENSGATENVQ